MNKAPDGFAGLAVDARSGRGPDAAEGGAVISPAQILAVLRRRWWLIALAVILALAVAVQALRTATPQYQASAQMLLGEQGRTERSSLDLLEARALTNSVIEGELAILRSSSLLARVVRRLELDQDPEFNPSLGPPPARVPVLDDVRDALGALRARLAPAPAAEGEGDEGSMSVIAAAAAADTALGELGTPIGQLRSRISARQQGSSYVVSVTVRSADPVKAAAIANTMIDEYIAFLVDKRFEAAQRFTDWLEMRIGDLAAKLERSESAVLGYRAEIESGAYSGERLDQQMRELTSKLVAARADLAEAEARVAKAVEIAESEGPLAAADVLSSPVILQGRADLAELRREAGEAERRFGAGSAQAAGVERRVGTLIGEIEAEVRRTVLELENTAAVLRINVDALDDTLSGLEGSIRDRSEEEIEINQLERIADADRRVYEEFLRRYNEATEIQNLRTTDAEVVSYASAPNSPATPRKRAVLTLALAAGLMAGAGAAFALELRPGRLGGAPDIGARTGLAVVGRLPRLPAGASAARLGRQLRTSPTSPLARSAAELLRGAELSLGGPMRSAIVTAAEPTHERTTVAMMLGWAAARRGRRCLLIDADTREAGLSERVGGAGHPDLLAVLQGEASLAEAVREEPDLDVWVLPTARSGADPAAVMSSDGAADLISDALRMFDVVVLDAPPMASAAEAVHPPHELDMALMVLRSGRTRVSAMPGALSLLGGVESRGTGAVASGLRRPA